VSSKVGALENADELKRRVDAAARFIPLDQLCLSPQCGFSSTIEGNELSEDEQRSKLALVVDVAEAIWG
jgi:5-methyltetrahydropteroyltriglutamate--homocysteine methyltransferase